MANLERVRAVVAHIELQIKKSKRRVKKNRLFFDMTEWYKKDDSCGTTMCYAGWAAHYAKVPVVMAEGRWGEPYVDGKTIPEWAEDFLGLTLDEADAIFGATDVASVAELKGAINFFLEEEVFVGAPEYDDGSSYERCSACG